MSTPVLIHFILIGDADARLCRLFICYHVVVASMYACVAHSIDDAITFHCFYGINFPIMYLNYEWKLTMNESMLLGVRRKTQQQKFLPKKFLLFILSPPILHLPSPAAIVQSKSSRCPTSASSLSCSRCIH